MTKQHTNQLKGIQRYSVHYYLKTDINNFVAYNVMYIYALNTTEQHVNHHYTYDFFLCLVVVNLIIFTRQRPIFTTILP